MKTSLKIHRKINLFDFLAFLTCCVILLDVPYINSLNKFRMLKIAVFCLTFALEVVYAVYHRFFPIYREYLYLIATALLVLLVTVFNQGSLISYISDIGQIICFCLMIVLCRSWHEMRRLFNVWCRFLFVLLLIDMASILIWPNGMYIGTYYRNNWFLGYKTSRLTYSFTLLVYTFYSELQDLKKLSWRSVVLAAVVVVDTVMSRGLAASIMVALYSMLMLFIFRTNRRQSHATLRGLLMTVLKCYPLFIGIYLIVFFVGVVFQNQALINDIIVGLFNRAYSFGERTIVWSEIIKVIKKEWLFGIGMQAREQYSQLTTGFYNAHNTLFTYLLTGGIVGLALLLPVFFAVIRKTAAVKANYAVTTYLYCMMFLGISSSAMAFCPFFFAILITPLNSRAVCTNSTEQWFYKYSHQISHSKLPIDA